MNESEIAILVAWAVPVLALAAPWRWTWRIWIAVSILTGAYVALIAFNPSDDVLGLRDFPAKLELALLLSLLLIIRGMIKAFGLRYPAPEHVERHAIRRIEIGLIWLTSVAITFVILRTLSWIFAYQGNDHMLHLYFIAGGIGGVLVFGAPIKRRPLILYVAAVGALTSALVSFAALLSMVTAASVTYSAAEVAGENRYCILNRPGGEEVTSWRQLVWITNSWPRIAPDFVLIVQQGDQHTALNWQPLTLEFRADTAVTEHDGGSDMRCAKG
jgi:hypothetical protein